MHFKIKQLTLLKETKPFSTMNI